MVSNQLLNSDSFWLLLEAPLSLCLVLPEQGLGALGVSAPAAGTPYGNTVMFGDSNFRNTPSTCQPHQRGIQRALWLCPALGTTAVLSWGSFCITPGWELGTVPRGWSWCGSSAASAVPGLALPPAPRPCQQRVVALSKARGCKQFPELPCPN